MRQSSTATTHTLGGHTMMKFEELPDFQKEFKQLGKKFKTLPDDFARFKRKVADSPPRFGRAVGRHADVIRQSEGLLIVKGRMRCQHLRNSSLRVIYAFIEQPSLVHFIEIYFKGDKATHNRQRIRAYIDQHEQAKLN